MLGFNGIVHHRQIKSAACRIISRRTSSRLQPLVQWTKSRNDSSAKTNNCMFNFILFQNQRKEFNGAKLVQALENLGFILGKDGNVSSSLRFKCVIPCFLIVVNLEQPGTFNAYNLAEFNTIGIVLFMQWSRPLQGNNLANLRRMMMRAAHYISRRFTRVLYWLKNKGNFWCKCEQAYLARV